MSRPGRDRRIIRIPASVASLDVMTTTSEPLTVAPAPPSASPAGRRLLAAAVLGAPVLLSINSAFHPKVDITAESLLEGAVSGPNQWYGVHMVAALGAMLGVAAAVGLRTLVVGRGRRLATVALGMTVLGAPLLAMSFAIEAAVMRLATELEPGAGLALAEGYVDAPDFYAVPVAIALVTLGSLLMAVALVLSRVVPRWMSLTLCVATVATALGAPGTPVGPVAFGTISVVSVFLALEITGRAAR
jgi:hypothetical protein